MNSLPDILLNTMLSLLPKENSFGRPESDKRKALLGIFHILRTGSQWRLLPKEFGKPSTVHGKFMKWSRDGIFKHIFQCAKEFYSKQNKENIWHAIDASHSKAPLANFSGKSPVDRGKRGIKRTILVDRKGATLAFEVSAGNVHDSRLFTDIVKQIKPKKKPQILVADSAYDCKKFTIICAKKKIAFIPATNRRRNKNIRVISPPHRWIVERTFGWFSWYRSLKTCWSKTKIAYESLFSFAASIQLFKMGGLFV